MRNFKSTKKMDWLQSELHKIEERHKDLLIAIQIEKEYLTTCESEQSDSVVNNMSNLSDVSIDLASAKNLSERLVSIAVATGNPMNPKQVASYLIERGYSKSTVANMRPHIYNALNEHPDFEKVEGGMFRYIPSTIEPGGLLPEMTSTSSE